MLWDIHLAFIDKLQEELQDAGLDILEENHWSLMGESSEKISEEKGIQAILDKTMNNEMGT